MNYQLLKMIKYKKVYIESLGYGITDFIPSEISGEKAVDIHHIFDRSDRIENLMAVTRQEHLDYGEIKGKLKFLLETHYNFLVDNGVKFDKNWILDKIRKCEY